MACSHDFLSMIFGIFGKFRVDIVKKYFYEIVFKIEKNPRRHTKTYFFEITGFYYGFPIRESLVKSCNFEKISKNIFSYVFEDFFQFFRNISEKYFLLCRREISQRFQKSFLENRASKLTMRKMKMCHFLYRCHKSHYQVGETFVY